MLLQHTIQVIKEAKRCHYDNQIKDSTNENKTTRDTVNKETHRKTYSYLLHGAGSFLSSWLACS